MPEYIEVNLLPVEYRKVKKDYSHLLDARVVIPTLMLILACIIYLLADSYFENKINELEKKKASIEKEIAQNKVVYQDLLELERLLAEKNAKNRSLKSISLNKQLWVRVMEGVNKALPPNSWLTQMYQQEGDESSLTLKGSTYLFSEVAAYMIDIKNSPYFEEVRLEKVETKDGKTINTFLFTLKIRLNVSLGLEKPVAIDSSDVS